MVPGTFTPTPDPAGQLGMSVETRSYAWSFPFTEYFVIVEYEITNTSENAWDSVWVGIWEGHGRAKHDHHKRDRQQLF